MSYQYIYLLVRMNDRKLYIARKHIEYLIKIMIIKKSGKKYTKLLSYEEMCPGVNLFERLFLSSDQNKIWIVSGFVPARHRRIFHIDEK